MIAKIKVVTNQAAIEAAHHEQQQADMLLQSDSNTERTIIPIPDPIFQESDLLFDLRDVSLAYCNGNGGINVDYKERSFVFIYTDEVWNALCNRFAEDGY